MWECLTSFAGLERQFWGSPRMFGLEKAVRSVGLVSRGGMPGSLAEALRSSALPLSGSSVEISRDVISLDD